MYKHLSLKTINQLDNCFKNCNNRDIAAHIFTVMYDAEQRKEVNKDDVFRLGFKILNEYLNKGE